MISNKVGDHSIDLPEASVVIQVGVVDGSRMQGRGSSSHTYLMRRLYDANQDPLLTLIEAQRLGRVQRKKREQFTLFPNVYRKDLNLYYSCHISRFG